MGNLKRYGDWAPTSFDSAGAFLGEDRQDWLVCPVILTRDSGPLEASNFHAAVKLLNAAGAEYERPSFGHWGPGWVEIIIIPAGGIAEETARKIADRLEDYPVLDEDDYCRREWDEAEETWQHCLNLRDRVELCREAGVSIFAARHDCIPRDDDGRIFERLTRS